VAGHIEVVVPVAAPLDVVWAVANDPAAWSGTGHPVRDLVTTGDTSRFRVVTGPDAAGRSWSYTVERIVDEPARTVFSRRIGSPDFRYGHVWFGYASAGEGTEMRCVVDFETTPRASVGDAEMAALMEQGMRRNMTEIARMAERREEDRVETDSARQLVDRVWAAIEAGEIDRLADLFDENVELSTTSGGGTGLDYVTALFTRHRQGYPDLRHEVLDSVESADGTAVALRIAFTGTHLGELRGPFGPIPPTGRTLVWRTSDHVRARDGRIVSWHAHFDRLTLLEQLDRVRPLAAAAG